MISNAGPIYTVVDILRSSQNGTVIMELLDDNN